MTTKASLPPATSLRALSENKSVDGITKNTTFRVDPDLIEFEKGFNLRSDNDELKEHVERIYLAIKAGAFLPPVDVQILDGRIVARDGHCRTRAARKWKKEMPEYRLECRQLPGNDQDALLHMLGTGTGSKPLSPLEAGLGYLRLIKMGLKSGDIADKLGVSRVTVDNGITLAEAPSEVQKLIIDGKVSATTAREAIKNGKEGIAALKEAVVNLDTAPAKPAKQGKKAKPAKVTAKKLKGTKAEKKTKKRKPKASTPAAETPTDPDSITVTVPREVAVEAVARIKAAAVGPELKQLGAILEMALI